MSICQSTKQRIHQTLTSSCERNEGHVGNHQAIVANDNPNQKEAYLNIVWGEAMWSEKPVFDKLWNECNFCGILIGDTESECNICTYWMEEAQRKSLPNRIIMDGILFNVEPTRSMGIQGLAGKLNTVIWYHPNRSDSLTDKITRYGKIPAHMSHLFGVDNGRFSPEKFPDESLLVPYGRHVSNKDVVSFLEECKVKEFEYMSGICPEVLNDKILDANNVRCVREIGHAGKHQGFIPNEPPQKTYKNFRWDEEDGASLYLTSPALWNECSRCGILILDDYVQCDDCNLEDRIHDIVAKHPQDIVIVDGSIFIEEEKVKSNEGISLTVFWNDKNRKRLISSYLKNVTGPMPKRYRDALPDNATIIETSKTDLFPLAA